MSGGAGDVLMAPVYEDPTGIVVYHGDCVEVMRAMPPASVDAAVTDPPYGLEFMGKEWDRLGAIPLRINGKIARGPA